jgi:HEXXH motif-containing protein
VTDFAQACRGFASPHETFSEPFLQAATVVHAREVMGRFLDRFEAPLRRGSDGLVPTLERWLSAPATFDDVWDAAFGRLRLCLDGAPPAKALDAAADAALRIAERGGTSEWEARLREPKRRLLGRILLPPADRLAVAAGARRIALRISRGRRTRSLTLPQPIQLDAAASCDTLAATDVEGVQLQILRRDAWEDPLEDVTPDDRPDSILPPLEQTLRLIFRHSPLYFDWIRRVVRRILPLQNDPKIMTSSTAAWRPGVLYSANRADPAVLAEMLLHEGSHQYMYVVRRLGPLDDGSDPKLYQSPMSGKLRPLGVVVLAYHALANIALFCRSCPARSPLRPRQMAGAVAETLAAYEDILVRSRAVTSIGRALWQPLHDRLRAGVGGPISAVPSRRTGPKDASESCRSTSARRPRAPRTSYPTARPPDRAARRTSRAPSAR